MRALLKGFGLTIWGTIGAGLLIIAVFVGYHAGLQFRATQTVPVVADSSDSRRAFEASNPNKPSRPSKSTPATVNAAHQSLTDAVNHRQYDEAVHYGQQIAESESASPEDLLVIAQSYLAKKDCAKARQWFEKAADARRGAGRAAAEPPLQSMVGCPGALSQPITPAHRERLLSLLEAVQKRAEADHDQLPRFEADASASQSGDGYVKLGQLYYGFGNYQKAIVSIERGLEKGAIVHLDDAFICLGRSKVALQDLAGAHAAFAKLKEVPSINPKIAALWNLYGDSLVNQEAALQR
jgi:tetratricopeptide (TPR) repeat protein